MPVSVPICRRLTTCIACTMLSGVLGAQVPVDSTARFVWRDLPSQHPRVTLGMGIVATATTIALFDNHLAYESRKFRDWSGSGMQSISLATSSVGGYLPLALGGSLAVSGWAFHHDFTQHLGTDVVKSVITSGVVTLAIKGSVGRGRPRESPDDADLFHPGKGFFDNNFASFPSGHTSAAFSSATVLAMELSKAHPSHSKWIKLGMYGAATAVGLSRMYENAHWASDVFAGAAIGTLSGMRIVRQRNAKP
ncbi:MAG: phosphatase PAP2 family protein [Gemmatimonadaceae bacterium]